MSHARAHTLSLSLAHSLTHSLAKHTLTHTHCRSVYWRLLLCGGGWSCGALQMCCWSGETVGGGAVCVCVCVCVCVYIFVCTITSGCYPAPPPTPTPPPQSQPCRTHLSPLRDQVQGQIIHLPPNFTASTVLFGRKHWHCFVNLSLCVFVCLSLCVCVCVCACVRACMCVWGIWCACPAVCRPRQGSLN